MLRQSSPEKTSCAITELTSPNASAKSKTVNSYNNRTRFMVFSFAIIVFKPTNFDIDIHILKLSIEVALVLKSN